MVKEHWRRSVFKTLMFSFMIILTPIYLLSVVIYTTGIRTLRQESSNAMISQAGFSLESFQAEVGRVRTLQYDLMNDRDINQLASIPESLDNIQTLDAILRVQRRMLAVMSSSQYITNVYTLLPAIDKQISALGVSDFDREWFGKLQNVPPVVDQQIVTVDKRLFLTITYPNFYIVSAKDPLYIIAVELSRQSIENTLYAMIPNAGEGALFLHRLDGWEIGTGMRGETRKMVREFVTENLNKGKIAGTGSLPIGSRRYLVAYQSSDYLDMVLCKYVPEDEVFQAVKGYRGWFLVLGVTSLLVIVVYSMYMYNFIHKPLNRLATAFQRVEKGELLIEIEHRRDDEFRYIYRRFNDMLGKLSALIDQVYKQKILVQHAQMKQLQSQINPHFLYNSFFILKTMCQIGDYDNLSVFLEQLGKYYQFVTRSASDEVPMAKEVEHARVYASIQAMRFANRLRVEFEELPQSFFPLVVPRLILQPLIENAFEHGLKSKRTGGLLVIRFAAEPGVWRIVVEDNGDELDDAALLHLLDVLGGRKQAAQVSALQNIHQRLQLKFGPQSGLLLERAQMGGLRSVIEIYAEEDGRVQNVDRR